MTHDERIKMTNEQLERLIRATIADDRQAREQLAAFIVEFVNGLHLPQLGPYARDPDCRAEVCARVVVRFLVGDYRRLREYLQRKPRRFRSLLRVTSRRVAIDLARSMSRNIGSRPEGAFSWVHERSFTDRDADSGHNYAAQVDLYAVGEFLDRYSDPVAVQLLRSRLIRGESWSSLAPQYQLSSDAARQRVRRLRQNLRTWYQENHQ